MPTADELYQEANCFLCYGISQTQALKLALLRRQALQLDPEADVSPETLLANASCYNCYANGSVGDLLELALLAIIAATPCTGNVDGLIWGPSPETVDSLQGSGNAVTSFLQSLTNGSNYPTLSFGNPTTVTNDVDFSNDTTLTSLTFRLLETVGGGINANGASASAFESIIFSSLVSVGLILDLADNPNLVTVQLDQLTSVGGEITVANNVAQTSLPLPALTSVDAVDVSGSGVTTLSMPVLTAYPPLGISADGSLLTLNLPACVDDGAGQLDLDLGLMTGLVTLNLNSLTSITAGINWGPSTSDLASVDFSSLATITGDIQLNSTSLVVLAFPSLTALSGNIDCSSILSLTSFSAPLWVPTDGTTITFLNDALGGHPEWCRGGR